MNWNVGPGHLWVEALERMENAGKTWCIATPFLLQSMAEWHLATFFQIHRTLHLWVFRKLGIQDYRNLQPVYQYHSALSSNLFCSISTKPWDTIRYHGRRTQPYQRMDGPSTGPWDWLWRRVPPNAGDEIQGSGQICCQNRLGFVEIWSSQKISQCMSFHKIPYLLFMPIPPYNWKSSRV